MDNLMLAWHIILRDLIPNVSLQLSLNIRRWSSDVDSWRWIVWWLWTVRRGRPATVWFTDALGGGGRTGTADAHATRTALRLWGDMLGCTPRAPAARISPPPTWRTYLPAVREHAELKTFFFAALITRICYPAHRALFDGFWTRTAACRRFGTAAFYCPAVPLFYSRILPPYTTFTVFSTFCAHSLLWIRACRLRDFVG